MDCSRWCLVFLAVCAIADGARPNFWNDPFGLRNRRQTHGNVFVPVMSNHPNGGTSFSNGNLFFLSQPPSAGVGPSSAAASTLHHHHQAPAASSPQRPIFHVNVADNTAHFLPPAAPQQDNALMLRQGQPHFFIQRPLASSATTNNNHRQFQQLSQPRPPVVHQFGHPHINQQTQPQQPQQQRGPPQNNFRPFFNPFDQFEFDFNDAQRGISNGETRPLFRPLTSFPPQGQQQQQPQQQQTQRPLTTSTEEDYLDFSTDAERQRLPSAQSFRPPQQQQQQAFRPTQPSLVNAQRRPAENNFRPRPEEEDFINDIRFPGPPLEQPSPQQAPPKPPTSPSNSAAQRPQDSNEQQRGPQRPTEGPSTSFEQFPQRPLQPPRDPFLFNQDPFFDHRPPPFQRPFEPRPPGNQRPPTEQRPSIEQQGPPQRPSVQRPSVQRPSSVETSTSRNRGSSRFRPTDFDGEAPPSGEEPEVERPQLPPTDSAEQFGIPPPTDDFGSKIEGEFPQTTQSSVRQPPRPLTTTTTPKAPPTRPQQQPQQPSSGEFPFPHHPPFQAPSRGQQDPHPAARRPNQQQFFNPNRPDENDFAQLDFADFFPPPPRGPPRGNQRPIEEDPRFSEPQRGPPRDNLRPFSEEEQRFTEQPPQRGPPRGSPRPFEDEQRFTEQPPARGPPRGSPRPNIEEDPRFSQPLPPHRRPPPRPQPTVATEIDEERQRFGGDFRPRPPNSFNEDSRPTFGPTSADQIQPPDDVIPFTQEPQHSSSPPPRTTTTTTPSPPTTSAAIRTALPTRGTPRVTPVPRGTPPTRVRSRVRKPTSTESERLEPSSSISPRRRVRPSTLRTTTTEEPELASSSAPRRRVRPVSNQQRTGQQQQRRKMVPKVQNDEASGSVAQQTPRRTASGVSRSQISSSGGEKRANVTRMVIKRRRPVSTTAAPMSSIRSSDFRGNSNEFRSEHAHSFVDSREQQQLSPSRRKVSIVSKFENAHNEDPHIAASHERASISEAAPKVRDHSSPKAKTPFKTTKVTPTTSRTTVTTTEAETTSLGTTSEDSTTAESTTAGATTTETAPKDSTEPEALNKLRSLLNRKFVFKSAPQSPTK